jgi:polyisoprenoid-binding protein YceI
VVNYHVVPKTGCLTLYRQTAQTINSMRKKISILILVTTLMTTLGVAQQNYRSTGAPVFSIAGTSTMHDWTMTSSGATYSASLVVNEEGNLIKIDEVVVKLPAESLKSKEKAMDKNAYKSLNTDKYKEITFRLTSSKIAQSKITCTGNLTISGVTKPIEVDVTYENRNGTFYFKGSKDIKMTDYKVEPPSFMFGTIKTGDEITISFEVTLVSNKMVTKN